MSRLLHIMARLRDPQQGCEWDVAQTFQTIAPYTIEEAYEVADAIERNDMEDLCDELGDLLLQVVFHARIAQEDGYFDFADVVSAISDKLERRHPHVFGSVENVSADRGHQEERWEEIKSTERAQSGAISAMDKVANTLPALLRAEKLQKRAAANGFDWPDTTGPAAKLLEEMQELAEADEAHQSEEAGDLLFTAVNLVRAYGIAPESALKAANDKFLRRFKAMEHLAGGNFSELNADQQEEMWQKVKRAEKL